MRILTAFYFLALSMPSSAAILTYELDGLITSPGSGTITGLFSETFSYNTVGGEMAFDPDRPNYRSADIIPGTFTFGGTTYSFHGDVLGLQFITTDAGMSVGVVGRVGPTENYAWDVGLLFPLQFDPQEGIPTSGFSCPSVGCLALDYSGSPPPGLPAWDAHGIITSISMVPLPTASWLFVFSLIGLIGLNQKRKIQ